MLIWKCYQNKIHWRECWICYLNVNPKKAVDHMRYHNDTHTTNTRRYPYNDYYTNTLLTKALIYISYFNISYYNKIIMYVINKKGINIKYKMKLLVAKYMTIIYWCTKCFILCLLLAFTRVYIYSLYPCYFMIVMLFFIYFELPFSVHSSPSLPKYNWNIADY